MIPEEEEKRIEYVFEGILAENFPNLYKETNIPIQETQTVPNKWTQTDLQPRLIIIKMAKVKERILEAVWEKQRVNYKGIPIRPYDFSTEMLQSRWSGQIYSKSWKGKVWNLEYSTQQDYQLE